MAESYDDVLLETEEKMDGAVDHLRVEFRGMRTGRAHPGLIENVKVDYYGTPTPLKQLANIAVPWCKNRKNAVIAFCKFR